MTIFQNPVLIVAWMFFMVAIILGIVGKHYIKSLLLPETTESFISEDEMKIILERELGGKEGVEDTILEMKERNVSVLINRTVYKRRGEKFLEIKKND